ncbi:hypothetical protein PGT21_011485 [Puccinia graminis f. sp. tritici]|uniref:DUF6589 domain-containing protein n=1 Tax=Puccinia graminis f. sp. tritici TaxID=56615 RepID=A0A5B0QHZ7_PUCGR|nr:hypothetical protein PGT21_011485 [Puccinia graminis f. sp. tritici]
MLKLMDTSDNSAEGIGQVNSSNQLFLNLVSRQKNSSHASNFQLGASHTLWNIAQNILTAHFGDPTKTNDLGAWHDLHALGIPSDKAVPKKDFDQMINNMEKIHEASIFHCLCVIMGTTQDHVAETPGKIETRKWNQIVEACYD